MQNCVSLLFEAGAAVFYLIEKYNVLAEACGIMLSVHIPCLSAVGKEAAGWQQAGQPLYIADSNDRDHLLPLLKRLMW